MKQLRGTGVAMVTPFNEDKSINFTQLEKLTEHLIAGGVDYLVVMGTTGETVTLTKEEKKEVLDTVLKVNNGRLPVVLGAGGNNTVEVCRQLESLDTTGIAAILSVSPAYNKPTQAGIYAHYKAVAESSPLPVILYNVPGRTSSNIAAETTLRLANDFENIIGVKEASGSIEQAISILKDRPEGFLVISGDDVLSLPIIACGGDGVISVVANALPQQFSSLVRAALNEDYATAKKLQYALFDIINALFEEGNPAGVKKTLMLLGVCNDFVRLPLVEASDKLSAKLKNLLSKL
ncbi:4-hydroxy-tetrahydrodipicolinate synthase [Bacteroidota bacterium]